MKYFILPAMFVALMSSCQQEGGMNMQPDRITLNARVSAHGDDAGTATWYNGDTIAVFFGNEPSQSIFQFAYDGSRWEADRALTEDEMTELNGLNIEAYTPWRKGYTKTSVSLPMVNGMVDQSTPEKLGDSDFLYSKPSSSYSNNELNLDFSHRLAQLKVIYSYSDAVQNVAPTDVRILNQPGVYTMTDGVWTADGVSSVVTVIPYTLHTETAEQTEYVDGQITAVLVPHKFIKGTEIMKFKIAGKEYSVKAPVDVDFKSGKSVTLYLAIGKYNVESITGDFEDWQDENLGSGSMEAKAAFFFEEKISWDDIDSDLGETDLEKDSQDAE